MRPFQLVGLTAFIITLAACSDSNTAGPQDEQHHATLAASPGRSGRPRSLAK